MRQLAQWKKLKLEKGWKLQGNFEIIIAVNFNAPEGNGTENRELEFVGKILPS